VVLRTELQRVDAALRPRAASIDGVQRLMTIPGIGRLVATTIYAWMGDVGRFPTANGDEPPHGSTYRRAPAHA
jgi:transposase